MRNEPERTTIATLQGVTKRYGAVTALDGIDLEIRSGELLALLGPNGAGKTTSVRLLLGLASPDSGRVSVFGRDPRVPANRVRTGAMLQVGKVPETLRVAELIDLFSSYYPSPLDAKRTISLASLEGLERKRYGDLSGGQQQRTLFALAICGDPDLLILDEPTVGLDVEARRGLWAQIRSFVGEGRSVLLTTHYLDEADSLADRIVVINRGSIVAEGSPAEIKKKVGAKRIQCVTSVDLRIIEQMARVATVIRERGTTRILTTEPEAVVLELLRADPHLSDLEVTGAGLEEAFLELTRNESQEVA